MFCTKFSSKGTKAKTILSLLFVAGFSFFGQAQEDKSAIVSYGEQHQFVFIVAILVVVAILVGVVALIFRKSNKKLEAEAQSQIQPGGFSKPTQKIGKNDERRYGTRKSLPQSGGFSSR